MQIIARSLVANEPHPLKYFRIFTYFIVHGYFHYVGMAKALKKATGTVGKITQHLVEVKQLKDLVDWFEANHETEERVVFKIYKKHTGHPVPSHNEQLRAAICYGWIDTTVKRIDDETFMRVFVKRKENAGWSENTLRYASELKAQGKMKKLGLEHYQRALKKKANSRAASKTKSSD